MLNRFFFTFFVCCSFSLQSVENSVIPLIEKFEQLENLPTKRYSDNQYREISHALSQIDNKVRVVSFNILFKAYDKDLDPVNRWEQRFPRLIEVLKEMKPDIIGIQELYKDQMKDLNPYFKKNFILFAKPCVDGELNGILYKKNRFELVKSKVWYMSKTPRLPDSETLTMVQLKDLKTGQIFAVFNVHLSFSDQNKRDFQARFMVKHITPIAEQMPVILTGDMNTFANRLDLEGLPFHDGDHIQRILTDSPLKDAKDVSLLGHLGPIATTNFNDGAAFKGLGTPGVFLDHIFVSKGINVIIHAVQPGTVGGYFPSDHFPIIMDCGINFEPVTLENSLTEIKK
jgi:endonuclease/exonuclease/phosphatase family metal-dependent hydrolase